MDFSHGGIRDVQISIPRKIWHVLYCSMLSKGRLKGAAAQAPNFFWDNVMCIKAWQTATNAVNISPATNAVNISPATNAVNISPAVVDDNKHESGPVYDTLTGTWSTDLQPCVAACSQVLRLSSAQLSARLVSSLLPDAVVHISARNRRL